jgi:hypothetical protein
MVRIFLLLLVLGTTAAAEPPRQRYPDLEAAGDAFLRSMDEHTKKLERDRWAAQEEEDKRRRMPRPPRGPLDRGPLDMVFPNLGR